MRREQNAAWKSTECGEAPLEVSQRVRIRRIAREEEPTCGHGREAVGVHDVRTKVLGSTNPHNVVRATFDALLRMKDPMELARLRGKQHDEI